jgi:hypothetical protein
MLTAVTHSAFAGACDHRPSRLIAGGTAAAVVIGGEGLKAAGLYTITNFTTGATMLGSTAAGTSGAGTVGIISGTAGAIGTAASALMSPFVLVPAGLVVLGAAGYEGACYLKGR